MVFVHGIFLGLNILSTIICIRILVTRRYVVKTNMEHIIKYYI